MSEEPHPGMLSILIGDAQCFHRLLLFGWAQTENFPLHITLGPAQPCCPQRPVCVFLLCLPQQAGAILADTASSQGRDWCRLCFKFKPKDLHVNLGQRLILSASPYFFILKWKKKTGGGVVGRESGDGKCRTVLFSTRLHLEAVWFNSSRLQGTGRNPQNIQTIQKLTNHCTPLLFAHKTKTQRLLGYGQKRIQLKRKLKETANPPINN